MPWEPRDTILTLCYISGGAGGQGGRGVGVRSPLKQKFAFWYPKTLLRMYLTLPVTSATSERPFSALSRLKNYLFKKHHETGPP